jgi:ketosteroid isomerase-like protein
MADVTDRAMVRDPAAAEDAFVECINRRDLAGLVVLMSDDHRLEVFDEAPLAGRDANETAWRGYFAAFPDYRTHPHRTAAGDAVAAVLGHTTGSHLGLPDDEESRLTLIWVAHVDPGTGRVTRWRLVEDTPGTRRAWGL